MEVRLNRLAWVRASELKNVDLVKRVMTIWARVYIVGQPRDEYSKPIVLYEENGEWLGLPREFVLKRIKNAKLIDETTLGEKVNDFSFLGSLNEDQQYLVDRILEHYQNGGYGAILQAPTGTGKTVMACYIISKLKLKTLVIVHKQFLMDQWKERLAKFTSAKVGIIQQDTDESDESDVTIAMMQTLISSQGYRAETLMDKFGLIVFDEVHHVSAPVFSLTAKMFNARYRLGLSATPYRKDGTDNVFLWHIGDIFSYRNIQTFKPIIKRVVSSHVLVPQGRDGNPLPFETVLRYLVNNTQRNMVIVKNITDALKAGRKVLVVTHRRKHVKILYNLLKEAFEKEGLKFSIGFAIGGMDEETLRKHVQRNVILGTYQYIAEGFDVPELDTLIMATPVSDPVQVVGRILRILPNKKTPIVVDIIDENVEVCVNYFRKRLAKYKAMGWQVGGIGDAEEYNKSLLKKLNLITNEEQSYAQD